MQLVKCANGHIYDMEKSRDCPTCRRIAQEQRRMQAEREWVPGTVAPVAEDSLNEQKTVPMFREGEKGISLPAQGSPIPSPVSAGEGVTQGMFSRHRGRAYVTGWLVAREGPVKGRDYRITHGMNWLGKNPAMDICILEDQEIADRNCALVYDGKSNSFFVVAASGSITRLNGQTISGSHRLETGDEIGVGKTIFEFIPFCREGHVWEES